MTNSELQAETDRLLKLSDSLVNAIRKNDNQSVFTELFVWIFEGGFAIIFASLLAFIASHFIDKDKSIIVFGSIIVFYGCLNISHAVAGHWQSAAKINDNINALRIAVIDLANRLSYYADKR